jgi:hypothetical protein
MQRIITLFSVLIFIAAFGFSCKNESKPKIEQGSTFSTLEAGADKKGPGAGKNEIFYGLLTPTEITTIFSRLGVPYQKAALNPSTNSDLYTSNAKAAMNLGIYGVDFGYIKMFGLSQQMIDYLMTIKELNYKLGIPDKYLMDPIKKMEKDISTPDSLMVLVGKSYSDIENHLRKDGRESTAGLMLMGGWIEAMYLTSSLLYNPEKPDAEVIEKITQQKYTLTSLLAFMKNYYDDPMVVFYTKKLIFLRKYFDKFEIYYKKGDLEINRSRQMLLASGSSTTATIETLTQIRDYVAKLRTEIVTP